MPTLRQMYFAGRFRWEPEHEMFETVGEAETYDFLANPRNDEAFKAACALDLSWDNEADEWLSEINWLSESDGETLHVALEQCCHEGKLLPVELRALRLQRFPRATQGHCEAAIKRLRSESYAALELLCWWVRIERAQRTGSPDLDPNRSLCLVIPD